MMKTYLFPAHLPLPASAAARMNVRWNRLLPMQASSATSETSVYCNLAGV